MLSTRRPHLVAAILAGALLVAAAPAAQESTEADVETSTESSIETPPSPGFTITPPSTTDPHYVVIPYAKMTVEEFLYHCESNVVTPSFYRSNLSIPVEDPDHDAEIVGNHYQSFVGKQVAPNGEVGVIIVSPLATIELSDLLLGLLIAIGLAVGIGHVLAKKRFEELDARTNRLADRVDVLTRPGQDDR